METGLIRSEKGLVRSQLAPETIEQIVSISDDDVRWLKTSDAGFIDGEDLVSKELAGIVVNTKPYFVKWCIGEPPVKAPFTSLGDCPENFELRVDVVMVLRSEELIGLSLPPSSSRNFSRYMRRVQKARLNLSEIVTLATCRPVLNKSNQKFVVIDFKPLASLPKEQKIDPKNSDNDEIPIETYEDDIPF